ncbi:cell division protein FtsQ/DivIB [Paenibacillus thalictri]|uniref:FtsQ-type POTRA domain-containing protein n=1 Tax=Paenibacillus thalictri TaxID=2527873 RepID=A0A4Q9DRA8_9BACL|nr:FtsQ-type POTRA domain-containing protein [Paenibacillus thalictri]TBL78161.1 FtsQ-type POTRA domain-containing protein [Paenibacillus thalictri]
MKVPAIKKPNTRKRSSRKLLAFLFIFFVTLLIILFFQSSLSKVSAIEVEGNEMLTEDAIKQALPAKPGDHFFAISSSTMEKVLGQLRMVQGAQVSKRFPGVIHVVVKEYPRVAFQLTEDGKKEVLLADGSAVSIEQRNVTIDKPLLTGWAKDDPNKVKLCQVMAKISPSYFSDISEIKPDPSESYPDKIKMYTRSQFEVQTTISYLPDKLPYLDLYITNLKENSISTGVLKLLEADNHMPFDTPSKDSTKDASKDPAKDPSKDAAQPGKEGKKTPPDGKGATSDPKKDPLKDTSKDPAKDAAKTTPKDTAKPNSKETAR